MSNVQTCFQTARSKTSLVLFVGPIFRRSLADSAPFNRTLEKKQHKKLKVSNVLRQGHFKACNLSTVHLWGSSLL